MSNVATLNEKQKQKGSLVEKFAGKFGVDPGKMMDTLKATAFKQRDGSVPNNEQMMALMVVADQYSLNPFTREIYAFPDRQNGIVPVVGVDGWSRIINTHPQFDGMEFRFADEQVDNLRGQQRPAPAWCECVIYRKDRAHPVAVREYLDEVYRPPFKEGMSGPWQTHTRRFMRHKTMIQASRLAFGFVGIFDEDEAERIVERDMGDVDRVRPTEPEAMPFYPADKFETNFGQWMKGVESGKVTVDGLIAKVGSAYQLTEEQLEQVEALRDAEPKQGEIE